jgi:hypothetical protein
VYNFNNKDAYGYKLLQPDDNGILLFSGVSGGIKADDIEIQRDEAFCFGKVTFEVLCTRKIIVYVNEDVVGDATPQASGGSSSWQSVEFHIGQCITNVSNFRLNLKRDRTCSSSASKMARNLQMEPCLPA